LPKICRRLRGQVLYTDYVHLSDFGNTLYLSYTFFFETIWHQKSDAYRHVGLGGSIWTICFRRSANRLMDDHPFLHCIWNGIRSEEHTSELQSRENLVCRLLLEK